MLLIHRRGMVVKIQQSGVVRVESLGGDVSTMDMFLFWVLQEMARLLPWVVKRVRGGLSGDFQVSEVFKSLIRPWSPMPWSSSTATPQVEAHLEAWGQSSSEPIFQVDVMPFAEFSRVFLYSFNGQK